LLLIVFVWAVLTASCCLQGAARVRRHSVAGDGAGGLLPPLPLVLSPPPPPEAEEKRQEQLQLETDKTGIDDFWQRLEASNLRTKQKAADKLVSSEASIALIKVVVDKVNSFLLAYFRRSAALPLPIPPRERGVRAWAARRE